MLSLKSSDWGWCHETVFLSIFPDARNLQKERNKRKKTHACGKGRKKRTISEISYRKTFHKGVEFADYFKKEPVMVYQADAVAFLVGKTTCSLVKHTIVQWKTVLKVFKADIIEESITEKSFYMFHISCNYENTTRWNRLDHKGVQTEVEWKKKAFELIEKRY